MSGNRMRVFGSWGFAAADLHAPVVVANGYRSGALMEETLKTGHREERHGS